MKLSELFRKFPARLVATHVIELYPFDKPNFEGFVTAYNFVLSLTPEEYDEYSILVSSQVDTNEDGEEFKFFITSGVDEEGATYGIEYVEWEKWLGMEISPRSYLVDEKEVKELTIAACCIWEMTFGGFTPDEIQQSRNNFIASIEQFSDVNEHFSVLLEDVIDGDPIELELRQEYEKERGY
jgi:hypothetical protein